MIMKRLSNPEDYIKDQFIKFGSNAWLEGWIRCHTDPDVMGKNKAILERERLMAYYQGLKDGADIVRN